MRLTILTLLLCLTVVLAQEAMPRLRYRTVIQDQGKKGKKPYPVKGGKDELEKQIDDIQKKVAAANETVVPFKGGTLKGLTGLLKVNLAVTNLGKAIDTTTAVAGATNVLSAADSTQVGIKFLGLQPDINNLLANLKSKRKEFDKAGFKILDVRSLIRDSVAIQQSKSDDLGRAFTKTLDAQFQPIAQLISGEIQGNFSDAIEEYKGRGGKIKIPTKLVPKLSQILAKLARALGLGKMDKGMMVDKDMMLLVGLVAPETDAATPEPDAAAAAEAASAEIAVADTAEANAAAQEALLATPDAELTSLGADENDLRGISPVILDVLRSFEII